VALRTPRALVFTIAFPLLFLLPFNSIFIKGGDETGTLPNGLVLSAQTYFTAGIVAYAVSLSTFTTLAVSLTTQRERGQLKRPGRRLDRHPPLPLGATGRARLARRRLAPSHRNRGNPDL
jgi:hypothetical protein